MSINEEWFLPIFEKYGFPVWDDSNYLKRIVTYLGGDGSEENPGFTDACKEYLLSTGLTTFSTIANQKVSMISVPKSKPLTRIQNDINNRSSSIGKEFTNTWIILFGPSRIARKSTALDYAVSTISDIDAGLMGPNEFTKEGITTWMAKKAEDDETDYVSCLWSADEFLGFLQEVRDKKHMSSINSMLSSLYECKSFTRMTISRKLEYVPNPFLSMFHALTKSAFYLMRRSDIDQGFYNRFIMIVNFNNFERRDQGVAPELTNWQVQEKNKIIDFLLLMNSHGDMKFENTKEGEKIFSDFGKLVSDIIEKEDLSLKESYFGNLPNLARKLVPLFEIASWTEDTMREGLAKRIASTNAILLSILFTCEHAWKGFSYVVDEIVRRDVKKKPAITDEEQINAILRAIRLIWESEKYVKVEDHIQRKDLLNNTGLKTRELAQWLDTLRERGDVTTKPVVNPNTRASFSGIKPLFILCEQEEGEDKG